MSFTYTNTPPATIDDITPDAGTGTAPGDVAPAALSGAAPADNAPAALTAVAPGAGYTPPALGNTAPADVAPSALSGAVPGDTSTAALTSTPPVSFDMLDGSALPLPSMPSKFIPAFNGLTGAGNTLASLTAAASDVGSIVQGLDGNQMRSYVVAAGTDAQALPGIVRPANFDAVNNAVVFVER